MPSSLGQLGESYAAAYLDQLGYRLVAANFTLPVRRNLRGTIINAEIYLIAYDGDTLCFIEVKTRSSDWFAPPEVNVDLRKRRQITRAARVYRKMLGIENEPHPPVCSHPQKVNVNQRKRRKKPRAPRVYRKMPGIKNEPHRYDVVT